MPSGYTARPKQLLDHDADCTFIKRWVPELQNFKSVQIAHAEEIKLKGYPQPVVCLKERAKEMKDQIFSIRKSAEGKESNRQMLRKHGSAKKLSRGKKDYGRKQGPVGPL